MIQLPQDCEESLIDMMRMHFTLLAECAAQLAGKNPDRSIVKLSTTVGGFEVYGAIMSKDTPNDRSD
ncbi:hypothetical protein [Phaeobacter inhibens]|uniref:hypothetical protein n=1 Tax=Phaeobacter inhibens TaxID=221822 RepID=UPI000C9B5410|nr:hypothetical protein [Phaeobacter inhibens]AUQ64394.1 hypothetical protein PhaeoP51_03463 [Phaeobacter inhibens]